jgi:4-nitrophenyl phosphatase
VTGGAAERAARSGAPAAPVKVLAFDLDGVIWKGSQMLPGVAEALADALARGLDIRYASNNSTAHREVVSQRLQSLGLPAGPERVLTSAFVAGWWLRERLPEGARVLVVGEEGLLRELAEAGLDAVYAGDVTSGSPPPAAVVAGMDRRFTYQVVANAQRAIDNGALFIATNRDATFPTPEGLVPGAGAIVAALATAARQEPVVMGKPETALAESLAGLTGVPSAQTLFIGDRLETDIDMAKAAGMLAALVLTGISTEADVRDAEARSGAWVPDYVLPDLWALPALLDTLGVPPAPPA